MGQRYLDRYENFKDDSNYKLVPGIKIPKKVTDIYIPYKLGSNRMDIFSNDYYKSPYFGWLIMLANPEYGGLEFMIPDNTVIRIPFPFISSVNDYYKEIDKYFRLYG